MSRSLLRASHARTDSSLSSNDAPDGVSAMTWSISGCLILVALFVSALFGLAVLALTFLQTLR